MNFVPPQVSKNFRYDWQFAVASSKLPFLRSASVVISLMPLLPSFSKVYLGENTVPVPLSFWVTWTAAVAFLLSWSIIQTRCPKLIREYQDFGQYAKQQHSHRWIVWLFYDHVRSGESLDPLVREALLKEVALPASACTSSEEFRVCPCIVRPLSSSTTTRYVAPIQSTTCQVFRPVNIGRDL